jgi:predicted lipoprotein with Yx(FWY)xxD motif
MKNKSLLSLALLPVLIFGLAACGSSSSNKTTSTSAATSTSASQPFTTKTVPNVGEILVDSSGQALYTNDQDTLGDIKCTGECAAVWVPLMQNGKPVGLMGKPLYTFASDAPGKVTGDGARDTFGGVDFIWTVATPSGTSPQAGSTPAPAATTPSTTTGGSSSSSGGGYGY